MSGSLPWTVADDRALRLRPVLIGLTGLAAAEEQMLLAAVRPDDARHATSKGSGPEQGSRRRWAAAPLIAHNTEFRWQQVERLRAIAEGEVPAEYEAIDHSSAEVYAAYAASPADQVARQSGQVSAEFLARVRDADAEDLLDPARHAWLRGRQLWLQIIVRGFWHPTGHLVEYYLAHDMPDRALALAEHAVATAAYLDAPDQARGMASYNLACVLARTDRADQAAAVLGEALRQNPDLQVNAGSDPDLASLAAVRNAIAPGS